MKLHFDPNQPFQLDAVAAIVDLFEGQPQSAPSMTPINVGDFGEIFAGQAQTELGVGNQIVLDETKLRENTRLIQNRNDIEIANPAAPLEAWELFDAPPTPLVTVPTSRSRWKRARARPTFICAPSSSCLKNTAFRNSSLSCRALPSVKACSKIWRSLKSISRISTTSHRNILSMPKRSTVYASSPPATHCKF